MLVARAYPVFLVACRRVTTGFWVHAWALLIARRRGCRMLALAVAVHSSSAQVMCWLSWWSAAVCTLLCWRAWRCRMALSLNVLGMGTGGGREKR